MLDINQASSMISRLALIPRESARFFPNGTCDELTLILLSEKGERCEILLEVTTGLADVEWDPNKFR